MVRNGKTFWSPVSEAVSVSSFAKWEQAIQGFLKHLYKKTSPQSRGVD